MHSYNKLYFMGKMSQAITVHRTRGFPYNNVINDNEYVNCYNVLYFEYDWDENVYKNLIISVEITFKIILKYFRFNVQ